ncbi:hypothetical protein [Arthrobacter sp. SLBN-53]|uniref:hypothetical protein n=1 Tax=Arthrobacter sp. SLBN-53 TaxID=2768412 RepID=UPI00114F6632|nr:hypothetical protein [Arthrobacter sp. SLBN-53]TQK27885.1 hypothetical protein FBY28_0847 [Arthrobacter sp. SLBN-53]
MTDTTTDTEVPEEPQSPDNDESVITESGNSDDQPEDTFPRQVVEDLRKENGKYRQRAQQADTYAQRLHTEMVKATGRLADPTDLPFDEDHLADAGNMVAAIDALLEAKPHLASRRPVGDIGQGQRGSTAQPFSLLQTLKDLT